MEKDSKSTADVIGDAQRLMSRYKTWKAERHAAGERVNQEAVAGALNMSQSAFSQFCRGIRPINVDLLTKLKNHFGWEPSEISPTLALKMAEVAAATGAIDPEEHAPVKMIDAKASAGKGRIVYSEDISKLLMFRRDWLAKNGAKPETVLAFPVDGDSMIDAHIPDESVVLANTALCEPISKRIYVLWIDGQLLVKQLVQEDGVWLARSHNAARAKDLPDIQIDIDDRVVGRAFWCGFGL